MTRMFAIITLAFPALAAAATGWVPIDCSDRPSEVARVRGSLGKGTATSAWAEYTRQVRTAEEGEGKYVPRPFPRTKAEVVEDFRYAYFERIFRDRDVPEQEQEIYEGLRDGQVALEVVRVENWTTSRCVLDRPAPYYHVVTILDRDGVPLARAALHYTGMLSSYSHLSQSVPTALLPLDDMEKIITDRYDLNLRIADAQYVALGGMPNHCGPLSPCVAFRSEGRTFILGRSGESLYALPMQGARRSVSAMSEEIRAQGLSFGEKEYSRPWLTVGFEWAQAELVAGQAGPRRHRID